MNIMCIIIFEILMFNFHGLRVYEILYVINWIPFKWKLIMQHLHMVT